MCVYIYIYLFLNFSYMFLSVHNITRNRNSLAKIDYDKRFHVMSHPRISYYMYLSVHHCHQSALQQREGLRENALKKLLVTCLFEYPSFSCVLELSARERERDKERKQFIQ